MTTAPDRAAAVELAREPDFRLGGLLVRPSAARVDGGGREQRVEPRVMQVLVYVSRQAPRTVSRGELIDACWGGRIVSDDAVNRVVAQVRGLARLLEPPPFHLETVPKVGFRLIPADARADAPPTLASRGPWSRRRLAVMAAAALVVLGVAAWLGFLRFGSTPPQSGRVEVAAFQATATDPALTVLAPELADAIERVLSGGGIETAQAGAEATGPPAELRVMGSVARAEAGYAADVKVLDRRSGLVLWSGRFQRPSASVLAQAAAAQVGASLRCAIEDRRSARRPLPPATFALLLETCADWYGDAYPSRVVSAARRLAAAAPDLAVAHALHGMAAAVAASVDDVSTDRISALRDEARAATERAFALDPRAAKAYVAQAIINQSSGDWVAVERDLQRALQIDAGQPDALFLYAILLRNVGRTSEALELSRRTNQAGDPRFGVDDQRFPLSLAAAGEIEEADVALERLERTHPEAAPKIRWTIAVWWEDPAQALGQLRDPTWGPVERVGRDCFSRYLARLVSRKGEVVRGLPEACEALNPDWQVRLLARQGDVEGAFAMLATPMPNSRRWTQFLFYPEMKAVRADPRFMPLAKRLGLVDYWRTSGKWPDFCGEPGLPYDCRAAAAAPA